jgi:prefoldin subunit 5
MERDTVAILAEQAGLSLNADELADLTASYQRIQAQLQALRGRLEQVEEPGLTFQAGVR